MKHHFVQIRANVFATHAAILSSVEAGVDKVEVSTLSVHKGESSRIEKQLEVGGVLGHTDRSGNRLTSGRRTQGRQTGATWNIYDISNTSLAKVSYSNIVTFTNLIFTGIVQTSPIFRKNEENQYDRGKNAL